MDQTTPSEDRRRHSRVGVTLLGRYMLPDQNEYPCQVLNISPGGIAISSPTGGEIGDRVVIYIDQLGRLEGTISRVFGGGFAMLIRVPERKRERLADQLTWLANRAAISTIEDRRHDRTLPSEPRSSLTLPDGRQIACTILDVSVSGASVAAPVRPAIGTKVVLGRTRGRVVRHHEDGIAVEFAGAADHARLSGHFQPARLSA